MKKNISFFLFIMIIALLSSAQNSIVTGCTEESLLQKPGTWKAGMKGSEGGTAADLAREKKIVAAIHTMIKSKYTPMSVEGILKLLILRH